MATRGIHIFSRSREWLCEWRAREFCREHVFFPTATLVCVWSSHRLGPELDCFPYRAGGRGSPLQPGVERLGRLSALFGDFALGHCSVNNYTTKVSSLLNFHLKNT